jgi:DedD protein
MPFSIFKRRTDAPTDKPALDLPTLQRQARQRLIGAVVLVVIAVVTFPLLFDSKPRAVSLDIPIDIPDKRGVKPLEVPAAVAVNASQVVGETAAPAKPAAPVAVKESLDDKERVVSDRPAASKPAAPKPESKPTADSAVAEKAFADKAAADKARAEKAAADKASADKAAKDKAAADKNAAEKAAAEKAAAEKARAADAARAQALLDGKSASKPADAAGRFVVQFGSFEDAAKSREARQKVEGAGMKTYAQVADTSVGKRTRVRVGPFASRAEAEKAATKIKGLGLPANILEL